MSVRNIIAVANQKGGVGKTTTAVNLGAALARKGLNVLILDLDPQGNASTGLGVPTDGRHLTAYDLLVGDTPLDQAVIATNVPHLSIVSSTSDLASADMDLAGREKRTSLLAQSLEKASGYDTIIIDCPPTLGLLTLNAMVAAHSILVPLQAEFYALEGLSQLLLTVREVRKSANPNLRIEGVVLTMVDSRNNLSQQVEADSRATLGDLVFKTVIPRNVRISEAPSHGMSVLDYDPQSKGSKAYQALCEEILMRRKEVAV